MEYLVYGIADPAPTSDCNCIMNWGSTCKRYRGLVYCICKIKILLI